MQASHQIPTVPKFPPHFLNLTETVMTGSPEALLICAKMEG